MNEDRFFREKEGKKARTIRSSLGKMLQTAYAYIHTLIRMPAIYPQHIPTPLYIITTHIPYISHICLCNPIYSLSLISPSSPFFPLYALSCTLYGYSCIMPVHCQILCTRHMRSISKHPVSRLQRGF